MVDLIFSVLALCLGFFLLLVHIGVVKIYNPMEERFEGYEKEIARLENLIKTILKRKSEQ
jgi:hypothetical protein